MSITAKELAKKLNVSATAVSMALHNKPGVSRETKNRIIQAAEQYGYDFTKLSSPDKLVGTIYIVLYRTNNAILSYTPIFDELCDGVRTECGTQNVSMKMIQIYEKTDDLQRYLEDLRVSDCIGLILIGTELRSGVCKMFLELPFPIVVLDSYFNDLDCDCIQINNKKGAYTATDYLISRTHKLPGYLASSYRIENFENRSAGFYQAVKEHGMSTFQCVKHLLTPTFEGACADMLQLLDSNVPLAEAYFADNDIIAIGVIKALKIRGYKIPEDISIIGFDNISESRIIDPSLTTMHVPRHYMAQIATRQLISRIKNETPHTCLIEISPTLVKRFSL